ncbi:MAG: TolC family protein [Rhodocyclales bacterium]|nr:TolC family protein [Rhodocyclales bacterium]
MKNKKPVVLLVAAWVLVLGVARAEAPLGAGVDELLDYARNHNPEFAAMRHEAAAAVERVQSAGALADPTVRMELQNFTNSDSDANPSLLPSRVGSTKYTVIQPLPWWGKRDLKREVAAAAADETTARAAGTWTELSARIKVAYALYFQTSRQLALTREVLDLVERLGGIAQVRYAGGLAPQADAIRAQVERTAMQNELIALDTERHHAMVRLNALLARPIIAALAEPERLRPMPAAVTLDATVLEARLRDRNPQLFAEDAKVRAAEKSRDLTYRNRYPDFAVGVSPIQMRNRINEWELMVEMNIPLQQGSRRAQEREAERMLDAARSRKEAAANQLLSDLGENLALIDAARRTEGLIESSLLPQAELAFHASLAGYETGKVDFATVLDSQRQIRRTKLDLIKTRAELQMRLADIERLIGEDL